MALANIVYADDIFSNQQATSLSCGIKPIPQTGCRIGQCVNGKWQQVCSKTSNTYNNNSTYGNQQATSLSCGLKPLPKSGCRIGSCINGRWEQVCSN